MGGAADRCQTQSRKKLGRCGARNQPLGKQGIGWLCSLGWPCHYPHSSFCWCCIQLIILPEYRRLLFNNPTVVSLSYRQLNRCRSHVHKQVQNAAVFAFPLPPHSPTLQGRFWPNQEFPASPHLQVVHQSSVRADHASSQQLLLNRHQRGSTHPQTIASVILGVTAGKSVERTVAKVTRPERSALCSIRQPAPQEYDDVVLQTTL